MGTRRQHRRIALIAELAVLALLPSLAGCQGLEAAGRKLMVAYSSGGVARALYTIPAAGHRPCHVREIEDLRYELADEYGHPLSEDTDVWARAGLDGYERCLETAGHPTHPDYQPCLCTCTEGVLLQQPINGIYARVFDEPSGALRFLVKTVDFSAFCQGLSQAVVYGEPLALSDCRCETLDGENCEVQDLSFFGLELR
jgi:hypothetical protein